MSGPSSDVVWGFLFSLAAMGIGGIAWWSYNHRTSYWKVILGVSLCITFLVVPALVVSATITAALFQLKRALPPEAYGVASKALSAIDFSLWWPFGFLAVCGLAISLQYVPKKDD